ncbi:hypothetical protein BKA66DRAFT_572207 [Pyrenochaeta sp. MPI-SDFR-AT-0127]|nr:hypothetical protein BKA66DRAFT_572207 [Pyrenochaeta sp. MPI-SDFR-AT-0127]
MDLKYMTNFMYMLGITSVALGLYTAGNMLRERLRTRVAVSINNIPALTSQQNTVISFLISAIQWVLRIQPRHRQTDVELQLRHPQENPDPSPERP